MKWFKKFRDYIPTFGSSPSMTRTEKLKHYILCHEAFDKYEVLKRLYEKRLNHAIAKMIKNEPDSFSKDGLQCASRLMNEIFAEIKNGEKMYHKHKLDIDNL